MFGGVGNTRGSMAGAPDAEMAVYGEGGFVQLKGFQHLHVAFVV